LGIDELTIKEIWAEGVSQLSLNLASFCSLISVFRMGRVLTYAPSPQPQDVT